MTHIFFRFLNQYASEVENRKLYKELSKKFHTDNVTGHENDMIQLNMEWNYLKSMYKRMKDFTDKTDKSADKTDKSADKTDKSADKTDKSTDKRMNDKQKACESMFNKFTWKDNVSSKVHHKDGRIVFTEKEYFFSFYKTSKGFDFYCAKQYTHILAKHGKVLVHDNWNKFHVYGIFQLSEKQLENVLKAFNELFQ